MKWKFNWGKKGYIANPIRVGQATYRIWRLSYTVRVVQGGGEPLNSAELFRSSAACFCSAIAILGLNVWYLRRSHSWFVFVLTAVSATVLLWAGRVLGKSAILRRVFPEDVVPGSSPRWAKYVLLLILGQNREYILGDLEEKYQTIVLPEYGATWASAWYWVRAMRELASAVSGILVRIAGLVILWKKAR